MIIPLVISIGVLAASMLSGALLAPSRRPAERFFPQSQWPAQPAPRGGARP
jgi:hypothetical protein